MANKLRIVADVFWLRLATQTVLGAAELALESKLA